MRAIAVRFAPASFEQRRMWMLDRQHSRRGSHNFASTVRLRGSLDLPRLQRSLDATVQRHGALRTALRPDDGDLVQVIADTVEVPIQFVTLTELSAGERLHAALVEAVKRAAAPFDLTSAPLMRALLCRVSNDDHILSFCFHQAIFDSWSEYLFLRDLGDFYTVGEFPSTQPSNLRFEYADFAVAQQGMASLGRQALVLKPPLRPMGTSFSLNLPFDHPRAASTHRGGLESICLPYALVGLLEKLGAQQGVPASAILFGAYSVLLHRYCGDEEIEIGVVHEGRPPGVELEPVIGCFSSTVGVVADLRGNPSFLTVLRRIREAQLSIQTQPDEGRTFQAMFVHQPAKCAGQYFGDLEVTPLAIQNGTSKCDLFLSLSSSQAGSLSCCLEFDADLFETQTATRLLESYKLLLESVVGESERPIGILPVVSERERYVLASWSDRPAHYPQGSSVHRELAATAMRAPTAVALSMGSDQLTYAELEASANRLARCLLREQVRRGDLIGVCLNRSIEAIVAQLAILKVGAAYLPLDSSYPTSRIGFMLSDADVRLVLVSGSTAELIPTGGARVIDLNREASSIDRESSEPLGADVRGDDLAYVMYTSGSTGRPNAVRIPHRGILRLVLGTDFIDWHRATTWLQMAPLSFDASTFEVWGALLHGARLVVFPDRVPTVRALDQVLSSEGVDCLWLPAGLFNVVVDEHPESLRGVSQLVVGGEALSVPHVRRAQQCLPTVELINGYGPTECTTFACCYSIPRLSPEDSRSIPIGRPIGNTSVHVWDRRKQPVPIGVRGQLHIGGDGVALGYHARPELTAERFVADPSTPGSQLYATGDFVRWRNDGVLEFLGRSDTQVKIRGFRIEPGEIEAICCRHPEVRDAVVLVLRGDSGEAALRAFVVERGPERALSSVEMQEFLRLHVPSHLVPASVVVCNSFPLTWNGKVDRDALLALDPKSRDRERDRVGQPTTAIEEELCRMWCELLQVDHVGVHDDFFASGGHSLLAVRMFSRIHDVFGRSLPFGMLLQNPTVAKLAAAIDPRRSRATGGSSLIALKPGGHRPPIFFVHGIGNEVFTFVELAQALPDDQPVFGVIPAEAAEERVESIEHMAASYLAEIEAVVQGRPFILGGHCSGAVTAFEIARQRRRQGRPAPLLVVFDYWFGEEPAGIVSSARNLVHWIVDDFARNGYRENLGRTLSKLRLLQGRIQRLMRPSSADDLRDVLGMWRYPEHEIERLRWFSEVSGAYRFLPHDGPVHVFRARARRLRMSQPPADMGWSRFAQGPLQVETVRGSHDSMFKPPFVRTLARRLEAVVEDYLGAMGR